MKLASFAAPLLALSMLGTSSILIAQQGGYGPPPPPPGSGYGQGGGWDLPPQEFRAVQQQGFRDGIDGAHHDMDNHRQQNVNNRDEFRHPHVPGRDRRDYKNAFARGYEAAWQHGNFRPGNGYGPGPRPY